MSSIASRVETKSVIYKFAAYVLHKEGQMSSTELKEEMGVSRYGLRDAIENSDDDVIERVNDVKNPNVIHYKVEVREHE